MELSLGKIKSIFKKEKQQDILYVLATVLIIGVIAGLFIWSISIVFKAVDAAFFVNQKDINEDILKFDFEGFKKIAPRLNINFELEPAVQEPVPSVQEPVPSVPEEVATTTIQEIPVDISLINLEILNGTATKGLAADWKEKFAVAGFKAENIKIGNADNKNYSGIAIYHNAAEGALAKIIDVFSQNSVSTKTEIDLKLDGISFIIIIGK